MSWLEGTAVELVLLATIWGSWSYATRNIRAFFELRLQVRRHLARLLAEAAFGPPELSLRAAAGGHRRLGYAILRLADKAPISMRVLTFMRYDPLRAADNLISLAYDGQFIFRCKAVAKALGLRSLTSLESEEGLSQQIGKQDYQHEKSSKEQEEDFRNPSGRFRDPDEAEGPGDQRDQQKNQSPFQH